MAEKRLIKTLMIEDDPFSVAVISSLGQEMQDIKLDVHHVVTLEESLYFLSQQSDIELIILDYRIHSKITGLEILQHIRAKGINAPVIVVTGSGDEEIAVKMLKAGASDYLVKGKISAEVLERSVKDAFEHYEKAGALAKESEAILKDIVIRSALNGVCLADLAGHINYANPAFIAMWGYGSEREVIGNSIKTFLASPVEFDELLKALQLKKSWLGELTGLRKDKTNIFLQVLFSLIEYEDKYSSQIMGSFIDISKIKDAETKRDTLYKGIMEVFALRAEEVGNVETAGHIQRIAAYTRFIAEKLSMIEPFKGYIDERYIIDVSYASMLHDVGKWRTPNEILLKPSDLTDAEWRIIKQHPKLGVEMLMPLLKDKGGSQYLKLVESAVLYHHERWDGLGYPEGLKGEEIPLSARIVALADNYDALVSERSYRKALTHEEAVEIIKKEKDKFDPRIWQVFMDNHQEFKRIKEAGLTEKT
jgi:PAS domain S-box-containing protein